MKQLSFKGSVILAVALLLSATAAFAGSVNKSNLDFSNPVQVNGTQLRPGSYTLKWQGNGNDVDVQFTQGKKVITTAHAKVVPVTEKMSNSSAVVEPSGNSSNLVEARFAGKPYKLVFNQETSAQNNSSMKTSGGGDSSNQQ